MVAQVAGDYNRITLLGVFGNFMRQAYRVPAVAKSRGAIAEKEGWVGFSWFLFDV